MGRRRPYRRARKAQEGRHDCDRTPEHPRCLSHRADGAHPVGARRRCAAGCALRGLCPGGERLRSRLRPDGPAALGQREHPWLRHAHHRRRQLRRQRLAPVERRSGRFLRAGRQHGPQDPATSWPSSTRCRARPSTRPSPRASSPCRPIARRSTAPIRRTARAVRSGALPRTPCPRRRNAWTWRAGWPAAAEGRFRPSEY